MAKTAIFALYIVFGNGNITYLGFLKSIEDCEAYGFNAAQAERIATGLPAKYICEPVLGDK